MVRLVPAATELLLMGHGSTLLSIGDGIHGCRSSLGWEGTGLRT